MKWNEHLLWGRWYKPDISLVARPALIVGVIFRLDLIRGRFFKGYHSRSQHSVFSFFFPQVFAEALQNESTLY